MFLPFGCECGEGRKSVGVGWVSVIRDADVTPEVIEEDVLRQRHAEIRRRQPPDCECTVVFVLAVDIGLLSSLVFHVGVLISVPGMGVFEFGAEFPLPSHVAVVASLSEKVLIPQPLFSNSVVEHDAARQSTLGVVIICLGAEFAVIIESVVDVHLPFPRIDVAVVAFLIGDVLSVDQGKWIVAVGPHV